MTPPAYLLALLIASLPLAQGSSVIRVQTTELGEVNIDVEEMESPSQPTLR